jgi:hypothetical protein
MFLDQESFSFTPHNVMLDGDGTGVAGCGVNMVQIH